MPNYDAAREVYFGEEAIENVEAATLWNLPFVSFKPTPQEIRAVVREHNGTRVQEQRTVKGPAHTQWQLKTNSYYDLNPKLFVPAFGAPANNPALSPINYTLTIGGSPTGGTYGVSFKGQTASIPYNANAAAIQTAIAALSTVGTGNVAVSGTGPFNITLQGALAGNTSLLTASGVGLTGGTSPTATMAGVAATGAFTNLFGVTSNVRTSSIVAKIGAHWERYLGASVDEMQITIDPKKLMEITYKGVAHELISNGAAPTPQQQVKAAYNHPHMGLALVQVNGSPTADLLSGSINIKFGRVPQHTVVETTDMQRAEEGFVVGSFNFLCRYNAYAGSFYEDYLDNTSPGGVSIQWHDLTTNIGSGGVLHPRQLFTIPNPLLADNVELDPEKIQTTQNIKGTFGYDGATGGSFTALFANEFAASVFNGT